MKFKCDNCEKETKVGSSATDLVCQHCGCFDLRFNCSISAFPVLSGNELGKEIVVKNGESFFGRHSQGSIWKVKGREDLDISSEEEKEGVSKNDENNPKEKVGLIKAIRKLKNPIKKE